MHGAPGPDGAVHAGAQSAGEPSSHADVSREDVLIVWDPARAVLWRKSSGSYLADHVSAFRLTYFDSGGRELAGSDFALPEWPAGVARVCVRLTVTMGRESGTATREFAVARA